MIKYSKFCPRVFPIGSSGDDAEINRAQSLVPDITTNREKIKELGNPALVGYIKKALTVGVSLTQLEYGSIEFWQKIANVTNKGGDSDVNGITLDDFGSPYFDIASYLTDDDGTFKGTLLYPALRTSGFSISIGEPQGNIERSFDFVGESAKILQGDNKYFIYQKETIAGDDTDYEITLDKTAVVDPDTALKFMQRVVRISSTGTVTELIKDTDYTEIATKVTIATVTNGDTIKLFYTSSSAPDDMFTPNTSDAVAIAGDSVDIYLYVPGSGKPSSDDYIYRLQSVTLEVSLDREDLYEIGNKDVVQRGVKSSTVTVTLGRILESFTVEEVLRGEIEGYGIIDVAELTDSAALIIKIYDDNTKANFKYGFKATRLSATSLGADASIDEYISKDVSLEGEDLTISANTDIIEIN